MRIPKKYGESMVNKCPFCGRQATATNIQGVPVCYHHKKESLGELKCVCGEFVELRTGKHGIYFHCLNCGNISAKKVFDVNNVKTPPKMNKCFKEGHSSRKELTITSEDAEFFD